jgi:hypothetical protein
MKAQRFEELMAGMNSFGKECYHKSELLNELLSLQREIVELTFNGEHAATADLKIYDVEKHLEQLNDECGHIADEELQQFENGCKTLCNLIRAEISGNKGEYKAFKTLEYLHSANRILKNVELSDGELHTELDAIVVTQKCIFIIEVKNTGRNVFIDEDGNYYRTGEFLALDSNIAEKIGIKEKLLRQVLDENGFQDRKIRSIVVFTNNRIEIHNQYTPIRTCFASQLQYIIDGYRLDKDISEAEMDEIQEAIKVADSKAYYPFEWDVQQYKMDFANLMLALEFENASTKEADMELVQEEAVDVGPDTTRKNTFTDRMRSVVSSKQFRNVGSTAAAVMVSFVTGLMVASRICKG